VTIELRAAETDDGAAVAALVDAAYRHYVPRLGMRPGPMDADYARVLRDDDVLLALDGDELVGVLVLSRHDDAFYVENVAVAPSRQKTGLGRQFLSLAEDAARRAGFGAITLYTHEGMSENLALYRRLGYVEFERRGFRIFMRKNLEADAPTSS
jgi:ribosomal protein S18 acetylase RimI-like enzyme